MNYAGGRHYTLGSSYLFNQVAGGERKGGLTVKLTRKEAEAGKISVRYTDWRSDEPIKYTHAPVVEQAMLGANEAAASLHLLDEFDVELSQFLVHDVDSDPRCYRQAARSACRSALEAWIQRDL